LRARGPCACPRTVCGFSESSRVWGPGRCSGFGLTGPLQWGIRGSGSRTVDALRRIDPDLKGILSSGYSRYGQAQEILQRGCSGFIQKPFSLEDLKQRIKEVLSSRREPDRARRSQLQPQSAFVTPFIPREWRRTTSRKEKVRLTAVFAADQFEVSAGPTRGNRRMTITEIRGRKQSQVRTVWME
jgi:hypothetical protein